MCGIISVLLTHLLFKGKVYFTLEKNVIVVIACSGLTSLSTSRRCMIATGSSRLTFYSAASQKHYVPDT